MTKVVRVNVGGCDTPDQRSDASKSPCEIVEYLGYTVLKDRTNTSLPTIPPPTS